MLLDHFRLLRIEPGKLIARVVLCVQELVELGMDSLGIAMLGALNHQAQTIL